MKENISQYVGVQSIEQLDERLLHIGWTDGKQSTIDVVELRKACPCASCVDEWTKESLIKPDQIDDQVRPIRLDSVGRYAMSVEFSDGHKTGIYTYPKLRQLSLLDD